MKTFLKKNKNIYSFLIFIKKLLSFKINFTISHPFFSNLKTSQYNSSIKKWEITNKFLTNLIFENKKNERLNFLNLGSGLGEIKSFTQFAENKISYEKFFKNFNYYTLDFFPLDLNKIKKTGDKVLRPDQNLTSQFIKPELFDGYPDNFHKEHIIFDLNLEFSDKSFFSKFDFIYCEDVLEHLKNPLNLPKTVKNFLKPDGICVLMTPFAYPYHKDPEDYWRFTHIGLKNLFFGDEKNDFTILECGYSTEIRREKRNIEKNLKSYWIENWWSVIVIKKN